MSSYSEQQTLLLIDGHSMAFRAFFALRAENFYTRAGQYTNAVHGFLNTLLRLIHDYSPTHVAVAFDLPGGTFRTRMYADYKGGRAATPEEFKGQIGVIQEVLDVLGITWITVPDFEADDIVATLCSAGENAGMRVYLASGDKDSYQLVDNAVTVLYPMPRAQMLEMTPQAIEEKTGVTPDKYEDVAALVGEGADNIPGVPGVGPKTAAKWINHYGNLNELLVHAQELPGKAGQSLRDHIDQVKLNRQLNQLVRDLPLAEAADLDSLLMAGVDVPKMHSLFDTLEFRSVREKVLKQLPQREGSDDASAGSVGVTNGADSATDLRELSLIAADGSATCLTSFIDMHSGPYAIAWHGDVHPRATKRESDVQQLAIAAHDGAVLVGDLDAICGADANTRVRNLAKLASNDVEKIVHCAKAFQHLLPVSAVHGIVADIEMQAYLLDPDRRAYSVHDLAQRYLGVDLDADTGVSQAQTELALDFGEDSSNHIDESLARIAVTILNIHDALSAELRASAQIDVLEALERDVSEVLAAMENRGIAVDLTRLDELHRSFQERVDEAAHFAHEAAGDPELNLSSPKQLQKVLFEDLGLPPTKKTKTGYTTNADALAGLLEKIALKEDDASVRGQQFLSALLQHRDAIKLLQSVEGLSKAVHRDGRIRTTYQQTVAATGRLSSTEPNLQNIHARTEDGQQIREVFVLGEGYDYVMTADYSQIEMRLMAHLSGDDELIAAFNQGADLHKYVASRVFGVPEESVTAPQRSRIKAMSYGLVYGLSAYGLSAQLHISVPEAQALMDGYFSRFGKVKKYLDGLVDAARRDGYTETMLGRRRYLPELTSTNRQIREANERMALNAPIQGSAADLIKIAMVNTERAMREAGLSSRVLLQVHDELVLEVVASELEQTRTIVEREMGSAWPSLSVPLTVGVGVGANWRDAAH